ncbi:MAG TPA: hypothetical protein DEO93_01760, partial [Stenotrophomonas sp.]|nr:hypothetical protein [Stenotrophomonas sp.]
RGLDGGVRQRIAAGTGGFAPGQQVLDLMCGPQDYLWVGTNQGLLQWVPARARFEAVPGAAAVASHALASADDGSMWVSEEGRLIRYRWNGNRLEREAQ